MLQLVNGKESEVSRMKRFIVVLLFLTIAIFNSPQVFADGYFDKDVTYSKTDLILNYEVDFFPGLRNTQSDISVVYLVNPNTKPENLDLVTELNSSIEHTNSLQQLDEIEVSNSNLLKVRFDHIWVVKN